MKRIKIFSTLMLFLLVVMMGCEDVLTETPYSQLDPNLIFESEAGAYSVLTSTYGEAGFLLRQPNIRLLEEWTTDLEWSTGGWVNRVYQQLASFTNSASTEWTNVAYNGGFKTIRNANIILDNIEKISEEDRALYMAEARFIRSWIYSYLYRMFGPVPLRQSTDDPVEQSRASEEEIKNFIETELLAVIPDLPAPGEEPIYGRATKGAAMGVLCKYYLNTKQWQKAADMAEDLMDLNYYELFPKYMDLFKVENNGNKESVWTLLSMVEDPPNWSGCPYLNGWFPPSEWVSVPELGIEKQSNWATWAVHYRLYDDFYYSFDEDDERRNLIVTKYINLDGDTVQLLGDNNCRSFKFWPDPNAIKFDHGNDVPQVRFADILLARAEALNELNGPTQDALDLIDQVRVRANLEPLELTDFTNKEELRDHILQERAWEFYSERIRRQDLIRHGKLIEFAHERGADNAQDYHNRFPIHQSNLDSNPSLEQNTGY